MFSVARSCFKRARNFSILHRVSGAAAPQLSQTTALPLLLDRKKKKLPAANIVVITFDVTSPLPLTLSDDSFPLHF